LDINTRPQALPLHLRHEPFGAVVKNTHNDDVIKNTRNDDVIKITCNDDVIKNTRNDDVIKNTRNDDVDSDNDVIVYKISQLEKPKFI